MFALSTYDKQCLRAYPEYKGLFENKDVLHTLAWHQELCFEHTKRFPSDAQSSALLEYEARIGTWNGSKFQPSLTEPMFTQLRQLFQQSKWCQPVETTVSLTQDMYYQHAQWKEGICRTRIMYDRDPCKPVQLEHRWKRKLLSTLVEARRPQGVSNMIPLAIRIDLSQEIPIVFETPSKSSSAATIPTVHLSETHYVKTEMVRFKWTETYRYRSPETGLVWDYHFNRVLEGKTKSEAEQRFRQLSRHLLFECECECANFLSTFEPEFGVCMTPVIYLFTSFLVKLNDWIKLFFASDSAGFPQNSIGGRHNVEYMYVCVQARLTVRDTQSLYNRFDSL